MPISNYSTTPSNNNAAPPNGFPEGMAPAGVNDGMRQVMADIRSDYNDPAYKNMGDTPTRTGATTFTVVGDLTARYAAGLRIRCTDSTTLYGVIASSSYSSPNTTVTVTLDSGSLSTSLTAVAINPWSAAGVFNAAAFGSLAFLSSVDTAQLVDSSVTTGKIAPNAVDGTKIAMGSDAAGDVLYYNGTDYVRLPIGTASQQLRVNAGATAPEWATISTGPVYIGSAYGTISGGTLTVQRQDLGTLARSSSGVFTWAFTSAEANTNYHVSLTTTRTSGVAVSDVCIRNGTKATSGFTIETGATGGAFPTDPDAIELMIWRIP